MRELPQISVLIPCYNNQQYIYECLASVFGQNYPNLEVIIGDDGSKEFDQIALEQWIAKNRNVNIKKIAIIAAKENRGTVANFEVMQEQTTGEFLFHIAADDVIHNANVIGQLYQKMRELGPLSEFVTAQTEMWDATLENKVHDFVKGEDINKINNLSPRQLFGECAARSFIPASSLYRRSMLDKIGKMSEQYKLVEDWVMHLRALREGVRFHFLNVPCIKHRAGGASQGSIQTPNLTTIQFYRDLVRIYVNEVQPYELEMTPAHLIGGSKNAQFRVNKYYQMLFSYQKIDAEEKEQ